MVANRLTPSAQVVREGLESGTEGFVLKLGGSWRLGEPAPSWSDLLPGGKAANVRVIAENLGHWDSSLVLFLARGVCWCAQEGIKLNLESLTPTLRTMVMQVSAVRPAPAEGPKRSPALAVAALGNAAKRLAVQAGDILRFIGECSLGLTNLIKRPAQFRWKDCLAAMQQCGAGALPIVSLISFLVGVIMAFQAAIQLRQFGADIYVADLVGLVVVREMGPMMAAVVLTGRTGAAFAAQIGNMKVSEEIDALETLGISPIDFLALPRLLALGIMMPLLAVYADFLGVLGGLFVAKTMLDIPAATYWIETQQRVTLTDLSSGLIKSLCFGLLVSVAGCLRGLQCGRGSGGVGQATTSAVVTGIFLIIVADAIFAIVFNILGI